MVTARRKAAGLSPPMTIGWLRAQSGEIKLTVTAHSHLRSWLSVPLKASDEYLGFLSIGHTEPNRYTQDHLRRAELLAIPAAAAIQNARLYSTADMYGSELQKRLVDLQEAETALVFR
jgi:GAF domain-containing protein